MQIEKNKVVTFYYQLKDQDGPELESNTGQMPIAYLHGHGNLLTGLEEALAGLSLGDSSTITLAPEKAYGQPRPNAKQRVPIKHLIGKHKRLLPGMLVKVQTESGPSSATIIKVGKFNVDLDFNHPFAGKTLIFDVTIEGVRDATEEELAHGHAHGVGGHHH